MDLAVEWPFPWPKPKGIYESDGPQEPIVVPIDGAGENVKFTVSSPLTVHGVSKVAARRAPEIGEHNDELLQELGFSSDEIAQFRTGGAIPHAAHGTEVLGGVR